MKKNENLQQVERGEAKQISQRADHIDQILQNLRLEDPEMMSNFEFNEFQSNIINSDAEWYTTFIIDDFVRKFKSEFILTVNFYFGFSGSIFAENAINKDGFPAVSIICKNNHFFTLKFHYNESVPVLELADSMHKNDPFLNIFEILDDNDLSTKHQILNGFSEFSAKNIFVFEYRELSVQLQKNGSDCGMHSFLNGLIFALDLDPSAFSFKTCARNNTLRKFFRECVDQNKIVNPYFLDSCNNDKPNYKFKAILVFNKSKNSLSILNSSGFKQNYLDNNFVLNESNFIRTIHFKNSNNSPLDNTKKLSLPKRNLEECLLGIQQPSKVPKSLSISQNSNSNIDMRNITPELKSYMDAHPKATLESAKRALNRMEKKYCSDKNNYSQESTLNIETKSTIDKVHLDSNCAENNAINVENLMQNWGNKIQQSDEHSNPNFKVDRNYFNIALKLLNELRDMDSHKSM